MKMYIVSTAEVTLGKGTFATQKEFEECVDYAIVSDRGFPGFTEQSNFLTYEEAHEAALRYLDITQRQNDLLVTFCSIDEYEEDEDGISDANSYIVYPNT